MAAISMVLCAFLAGCTAREPIHVLYFYSPVCSACEDSRSSLEYAASLARTAQRSRRIELHIYDVVHSQDGIDALFAVVDKYRLPADAQRMPLLIVDGTPHSGLAEVEAAVRALAGP